MFAYIKGILVSASPSHAIVDVNGIGYAIAIPCRVLGELPAPGNIVHLYTTFVVRELSQALYGFLTSQERDLFEILTDVSGVGPKLGLSLIGHLTFTELQTAVACQDLPTLCRVPGVGKKTAERLIVELKDKLPFLISPTAASLAISVSSPSQPRFVQDAMLALINLGYNQSVAQKAILHSLKELPENGDLSLLITIALKNVNSR